MFARVLPHTGSHIAPRKYPLHRTARTRSLDPPRFQATPRPWPQRRQELWRGASLLSTASLCRPCRPSGRPGRSRRGGLRSPTDRATPRGGRPRRARTHARSSRYARVPSLYSIKNFLTLRIDLLKRRGRFSRLRIRVWILILCNVGPTVPAHGRESLQSPIQDSGSGTFFRPVIRVSQFQLTHPFLFSEGKYSCVIHKYL
jgi:hypothetical protein